MTNDNRWLLAGDFSIRSFTSSIHHCHCKVNVILNPMFIEMTARRPSCSYMEHDYFLF